MYKLAALDLDGTLLSDTGKISQPTKQTISRIINSGIKVILVSGRCYQSILNFSQQLNLETPIISNNGALIRHKQGQIIHCKTIPNQLAKKILGYRKEKNLPHIGFYYPDGIYVDHLSPGARKIHIKTENITPKVVSDLKDTLDKNLINIVISVKAEKMESAKTKLRKKFSHQLAIVQSTETCIDFTMPTATKGNALKNLLTSYSISPAEVLAIGDNDNDLDLIKTAGLGIAMKNAHPQLKKAADKITAYSNNQNGAAKILNKIFLN